ncbi:MAG: dephospho-CoA kinase [Burkholderiaceae bacterium]
MPFRLGLTGGIASGKSTVAQMLAAHGAALIDADAIARQVTGPGGQAMAALAAEFGTAFVTQGGALDRDKMRALAFADGTARDRLQAIVHPWVSRLATLQSEQATAAGAALLVFDVPLLVESAHWRSQLHAVLVVDCEPETQTARAQARSGLDSNAVRQIIAAQASRSKRLAAADLVLYNDGISLEALRAEVALLVGRLCLAH